MNFTLSQLGKSAAEWILSRCACRAMAGRLTGAGRGGAYGELAGGGGDVDGVLLLTGRVQVHLVGLAFAPQLLQGQSHCQVLGQVINRGVARGLDVPATAATQITNND